MNAKDQKIEKNITIHIAFICDENYVMPTAVAIESLFRNKKPETNCFIHILASNITRQSQDTFAKLAKENFEVEVLDLSQSEILKKCKIENLHVSTAALYKFNIAELFPDYTKMLYMDGDVLVKKDLTELYLTDISDVYAAVVKDQKPTTYQPPQVEKLHINHSAYFNSGVMLLNLEKLRRDKMSEKLIEYRIRGINYFMDQDALNVVFSEKVKYLSLLYNVMSSVTGYFKTKDILEYYELHDITTKEEIYEQATIIHLCTKYKPWDYTNVPFSEEWMTYFRYANLNIDVKRKELGTDLQKKLFSELELTVTPQDMGIKNDVIVSLTSYPARIKYVAQVIDSIKKQTIKPNKILLWLAREQFENGEKDLPKELVETVGKNIEIKWCDDLRPHKKYFYSMLQCSESIIITVDDDIYYDKDLIEKLLRSYIKYPYAVSAMRAHLITFDENGKINLYKNWKRENKIIGIPSYALCATGVGGVLYPPNCLHPEAFNETEIKNRCLNADDLWLKVMEVLVGTPVVSAENSSKIICIDGTQETALWKMNDTENENDEQFKMILEKYNTYIGEKESVLNRIHLSYDNFSKVAITNSIKYVNKDTDRNEAQLIRMSWSYRIGRFFTFVPRKVRGGIRCYQENGWSYTWNRILVHLHIKKS